MAVGGGGGSAATFRGTATDPADLATYTFATQPVGTAAANRRVIVAFHHAGSGTRSVSSATIGGVTATLESNVASPSTGARGTAIFSAVVPTGTTATVVVNLTSAATRAGMGLWTANGVAPTGQSDNDSSAIGTPNGSMTVTTAVNDLVIAGGVYSRGTLGTMAVAWTGATEDYETTIESSGTVLWNTITGAQTLATGTSTVIAFDETGGAGTEYWAFAAAAYA